MPATSSPRIDSLQAARGFAALSVACMHILTIKGLMDSHNPISYGITLFFASFGSAGIDIFFVISGFIIPRASTRLGHGLSATLTFLKHRIWRLYPLHITTFLLMVVIENYFHKKLLGHYVYIDLLTFLRELTLTISVNIFQPPAWTLAYEMYFYAGYAFILLFPRRLLAPLIVLWACGQLLSLSVCQLYHACLAVQAPSVLEFFFGIGLYYIYRTQASYAARYYIGAMILGAGLFIYGSILCGWYYWYQAHGLGPWERIVWYGMGATCFLWGYLCLERQGKLRAPAALTRLGDWSYSIYLWHIPVSESSTAIKIFVPLALPPYFDLLAALVQVPLTILVAKYSYLHIERPALRFAHRQGDKRP